MTLGEALLAAAERGVSFIGIGKLGFEWVTQVATTVDGKMRTFVDADLETAVRKALAGPLLTPEPASVVGPTGTLERLARAIDDNTRARRNP